MYVTAISEEAPHPLKIFIIICVPPLTTFSIMQMNIYYDKTVAYRSFSLRIIYERLSNLKQVTPGFINCQPQPKYSWALSKIKGQGVKMYLSRIIITNSRFRDLKLP